MASKFLLRGKDDTENPVAPRAYDLGITVGRNVFYLANAAGNRTAFIAILSEGARFYGDTGIAGALKVLFAGFDIPEFDASGARNWRVHKGFVPAPLVEKTITANLTTDRITAAAHGYNNGDEVAFYFRGKSPTAFLPAPLVSHKKYFVVNKNTDDFQVSLTSGGAPVDFTTVCSTGVSGGAGTCFVYKANAGFFDAEQGRPFFFPNLNYCFAGLAYIELLLPADLSNGEDEPTKLKVKLDGKEVFNFEADGAGLLQPVGDPISSRNNALISFDALRNDGQLPPERFGTNSWLDWRDYCDEKISWTGGNDISSTPAALETLTNCLYSAEGGVLQASGNASAFTTAFTARNATIEAIYGGGAGDASLIFTDAQSISTVHQKHGIIIQPNGTMFFTNGVNVYIIGNAVASDRIKITYEETFFKVYKNSVPVSLGNITVAAQPAGNFYCGLALGASGQRWTDIKIQPSGTTAAPRQIERATGGIVLLGKTPIVEIFETEIALSAGTSWQDVDGEIVILPRPNRAVVATFNADPNASYPANCKRITIKRRGSKAAPTDYRFSFRDRDDPVLLRKYVFIAREERRDEVGYIDSGMIELGVMTQSHVERYGETLATLRTDLDIGWTVEAFLDTLQAAKGDFVHIIDPASGFTEENPALGMIISEVLDHNAAVENRNFEVALITPDFYSDTRHGRATFSTHTHIGVNFLPPPPLQSLTLSETVRIFNGASISVLEGSALFAPSVNQKGKVFLRKLGAGFSFTADFATNEIDGENLSQFINELVLFADTNNGAADLPEGLLTDEAYKLVVSAVDSSKFQLQNPTTLSVINFTSNGGAAARLFPFSAWQQTPIEFAPNAETRNGIFSLDGLEVGFYQVRVQTFSAGGATLGFLPQTLATIELVGDQLAPDAPEKLRATFDGVTIFWRFNPSPSLNVAGYQVTDELGRVLFSFISTLEFSETLRTPIAERRVYAVSRSGVRSIDYAAATFVRPPVISWFNAEGADINIDNRLTKVAATSWGNCGAVLSHAILTNAISGEVSYTADTTDQYKIFGFSRYSSVNHFEDFFAALYLKEDGSFSARYLDNSDVPQEAFIGTYNVGDEFLIRLEKNLNLAALDTIKIYKVVIDGARRLENLIYTFPSIYVRFPAYVGVALYETDTFFEPFLQIAGELIGIEEIIPYWVEEYNIDYYEDTGTLSANGSDAYVNFGSISNDTDAIFEFFLESGSEYSFMFDPFPFIDPTTPSFFSLDCFPDSSMVIRFPNGSTYPIGNYVSTTKIAFARENGIATVRVDGRLIYKYGYVGGFGGLNVLFFPISGELSNLRKREVVLPYTDEIGNRFPLTANVEQARVGGNKASEIPVFALDNPQDGEPLIFEAGKVVTSASLKMLFATIPPFSIGSPASGDLMVFNGTAWTKAAKNSISVDSFAGTLSIAKGGTGQTSATAAINALLPPQASQANKTLLSNGTVAFWGNLPASSLSGTIPVASGGTGQTSASAAINALLPSQTSQSGKVLSTNGTVASWVNSLSGTFSVSGLTTLSGGLTVANTNFLASATATVGAQIAASRYIQLNSSIWRTDTSTAQAGNIRIYNLPNQTNLGAVATCGIAIDFNGESTFRYQTSPSDYLTTRIKFGNPHYEAWGGMLDIYYDGSFYFKKIDGNYGSLVCNQISGGATGYPMITFPSIYTPEIRSHFGQKILFEAGRPAWLFGDNAGNLGSEYVEMKMSQSILNNLASRAAFSVKSANGQSAALIEVQTFANAVNFSVFEDGKTVIGTSSITGGKLQIRSITEVFRFEYDGANYGNITVSSTALITFSGSSGAKFRFSRKVEAAAGAAFVQVGGTLFDYTYEVTSGVADADIYADTLIADTLAENGAALRAWYSGTFSVSTDQKYLKVWFAGSEIFNSGDLAQSGGSWIINVHIIRVSSTVAWCTVHLACDTPSTTDPSVQFFEVTGLNFSSALILKVRASSDVKGEIQFKGGKVLFEAAE